jgi:branched-chain amino acid transport system permease protein
MVSVDLKRDRVLLRWGTQKYEWCIEPRYWRNPIFGVAFLMILPLFFFSYPHLLTMLTTANLLAALAIPLSLQILGTARVNFGPQFYLGIGGYTAALLNLSFGWNPFFTLLGTIFVCGSVALMLSPITWIARGLYFSLITLILPLAFLDLTYQFGDIFRGEVGLFGMSPLFDLGRVTWNYLSYYYLSLFLMLLYLLGAHKITKSRFGVSLAAINENENVARMMGINVSFYKVIYYVVPSILTGIVGWFIVHTFRSFAGVTYLPLEFMLKVLFIVIIGGRASVFGAVPGAYAVSIIEEALRSFGHISHWVFPLVLVAMIYLLPRGEGLWGLYKKRHPRDYYPKMHVRRE